MSARMKLDDAMNELKRNPEAKVVVDLEEYREMAGVRERMRPAIYAAWQRDLRRKARREILLHATLILAKGFAVAGIPALAYVAWVMA